MDKSNKPLNVRLRGETQKRNVKSSNVRKATKKKNTKNTDNNTPKNTKKKNKKIGWKIFRVFLFVFIALGIIGAGIVLGVISGIVDDTESISLDELELLPQTSFVYDKDGNEISSLYDSENRIMVSFDEIPTHAVNAVVAIEDERFFTHHGIDIKRTAGAVVTYIINGGESDYGASTITQQLVKNITSDKERAWQRKIREWYRAISLENKLEKNQIFESYVNTIYYGDGCYGIEVASNHFFGKSTSELNIAEAAAIAAMIQSPEVTNPYKSDEAKQKLLDRQSLVLDKMKSLGLITEEEYNNAKATELNFVAKDVNVGGTQSYFVDAVVEAVIKDLMDQRNVSRGIAVKMIYTDGYKIYTTQDQSVQSAIDNAFADTSIFKKDLYEDMIQGSMVVIDHTTGEVRGLIGGAGEKEGALTLNRATQTFRQPGSCMKPFGAYGPAFEKGVLSPGAGLDDTQFSIGNWTPVNWYGYYRGYVSTRWAIMDSMNIPACRANMLVNDQDFAWNFAYNCGLTSLVEADKSIPALALGGVTKGFTTLEVANAYATIANNGYHITPKLYTKVVDRNGEIVLDNTAVDAKQVMSDSTAFMLTSCLSSVVETPGGTAYGAVRIKNGAIQCAGKTGNTDDDKDRWFCGFTPYYTIACWTGYDQAKPIKRGYPYDSTKLFNTVMNAICADKGGAAFAGAPSSVTRVDLCQDSGKIATEACMADPRGSRVLNDFIAVDAIPTDKCAVHEFVNVCERSGKLASASCKNTVKRSCITRAYVPSRGVFPGDWGYMKPTETCNTCRNTGGNVVIYRNGKVQ
ncbi:MAG: penicillin-binding protein [Clostridia bacterium]|nr:penicillin-binding protein [Clostridia bacterium]